MYEGFYWVEELDFNLRANSNIIEVKKSRIKLHMKALHKGLRIVFFSVLNEKIFKGNIYTSSPKLNAELANSSQTVSVKKNVAV